MTFTHAELVKIARRWLVGYARCDFAFAEYGTGATREVPDALGFLSSRRTLLIECKVSRGDFQADRKKPWRKDPALGVGDWRYYLAPQGLIAPEDLPEKWGLLEVTPHGTVKRRVELAITTRQSRSALHQLDDPYWQQRAQANDPRLDWLREWQGQVAAQRFPKNSAAEDELLYSVARRLHVKGCWDILKTDMNAEVHWHVGACPGTPPGG